MKKLSSIRVVIISWALLFLFVIGFFSFMFYKARKIILAYGESESKNFLVSAADKAIINVSNSNNITYDKISDISRDNDGNVTSININTNYVNLLKSSISSEILNIIGTKNDFNVFIPIGSLINNEFTNGIGKKIKFNVLVSHFTISDFQSIFTDAGINQTLHQIIIKIDLSGSVITRIGAKNFSMTTTALVAQTVIVGKVPSSYTNVIENENSDMADKLFNYSNKN